jgi:hypothetical protein
VDEPRPELVGGHYPYWRCGSLYAGRHMADQ